MAFFIEGRSASLHGHQPVGVKIIWMAQPLRCTAIPCHLVLVFMTGKLQLLSRPPSVDLRWALARWQSDSRGVVLHWAAGLAVGRVAPAARHNNFEHFAPGDAAGADTLVCAGGICSDHSPLTTAAKVGTFLFGSEIKAF